MEFLADDPEAAERNLRGGYGALPQMGEQAVLSTTAAFLARAVFAQGRADEAEELYGGQCQTCRAGRPTHPGALAWSAGAGPRAARTVE